MGPLAVAPNIPVPALPLEAPKVGGAAPKLNVGLADAPVVEVWPKVPPPATAVEPKLNPTDLELFVLTAPNAVEVVPEPNKFVAPPAVDDPNIPAIEDMR